MSEVRREPHQRGVRFRHLRLIGQAIESGSAVSWPEPGHDHELRGTLHAAAVKAPVFGYRRKAMLEDIATLTIPPLLAYVERVVP